MDTAALAMQTPLRRRYPYTQRRPLRERRTKQHRRASHITTRNPRVHLNRPRPSHNDEAPNAHLSTYFAYTQTSLSWNMRETNFNTSRKDNELTPRVLPLAQKRRSTVEVHNLNFPRLLT